MSLAQAWEEQEELLEEAVEEGPYTEEDYNNIPEHVRAELIEGHLIYNLATPSRFHQTILGEMYTVINNYIKSKGGSCEPFFAPFAVFLNKDDANYVEPDISVICDSKL